MRSRPSVGTRARGQVLACALLAMLSYLTLARPPVWLLWFVRIGVTEWGYWLAPLVPAALSRRWRRAVGAPTALAAALTALLALGPLLRALPVARGLRERLVAAFGEATPRSLPGAPARAAPLVAADLLRGVRSPRVERTHHAYARRGARALTLDLYRPLASDGPLPLIVVVHGGAWQKGDPHQLPALNRYLAARGYAVAAISYRLAPEHRFPAQLDDVRAALGALRGRAAELRIDPERIVLLGRSAGGHLALLAGCIEGSPAVRGVVAFYAPADLAWGYGHPTNPLVLDSQRVLRQLLGGSPDDVPEAYCAASPLSHIGADAPPTLLIHGGSDEMVWLLHSERVARELAAHGRPHLILELPWAAHGCDANLSGPSGQLSTFAIERFLAAVCA